MSSFQEKIESGIIWLSQFRVFASIFEWMAEDDKNQHKFIIWFNVFNASLIFTALISPWIFVVWGLVVPILLFRSSPLAPLARLIEMVRERTIGFTVLMITVFFMMLHYICLFACFYMIFGVVEGGNNQVISSLWDHIYFSVVTFTTLGYGNFVPANTAAEVIAAFEAIIGFSVFAFLIGIVSAVALQDHSDGEK
ncbi:potassium channel family protein [Ferrimonas balearica]|uniref:potassium channel family protein n=1 Tax=Ferrimonas balearica TaxID=44012 RepID=UPI001C585EE2|nr:ion channel [Ferrimonas balearica]MBW3163052.1 potassium channel family protein [Ferrimonas balearica]